MKRERQAFTLIELLVVIAIIAILMAIMLPALGFVDSRVERVPLQELWTHKWHRTFAPNPDVALP